MNFPRRHFYIIFPTAPNLTAVLENIGLLGER